MKDHSSQSNDPEFDPACTIYVRAQYREDLLTRVSDAIPGVTKDGTALRLSSMRASWIRNDYEGTAPGDENFIGWPSVLDCEPVGDPSLDEIVENVSSILRSLWSMEIRAVAACDYENELPFSGGSAL
jgi:hypothetical protein